MKNKLTEKYNIFRDIIASLLILQNFNISKWTEAWKLDKVKKSVLGGQFIVQSIFFYAIKFFISSTAFSSPVKIALEMILCPMFNS